MDQQKLRTMFDQTLEDRRLSRSERRALKAVLDELSPTPEERLAYIGRAFDAARAATPDHRYREIFGWLEDLVKTLYPEDVPSVGEACFAPHQDCVGKLRGLLDAAEISVDICVFTITDDRIVRSVLAAHRRGVGVRVISDDEKALDRGSDIYRLKDSGVQVRTDDSPDHMHHKFAILDRRLLVNGSYNWTRSASERNNENISVSDDQHLVGLFRQEFERLWDAFAP
jgi:cardiolipin hydrolase